MQIPKIFNKIKWLNKTTLIKMPFKINKVPILLLFLLVVVYLIYINLFRFRRIVCALKHELNNIAYGINEFLTLDCFKWNDLPSWSKHVHECYGSLQ